MSEWKEVKLSMLGNIITGKTPRTVIEENYGGDIPFLTPSDDMSVKHVYFTKKTLSEKGVMEVKNCLLPSGSVCVSCIGSDLGKVVITTCNTVTNQQINSIVVNEKNNNDFVYYLLTIVGKELNRISKTSTAVPIINKSSFSSYEVKIPDLFTQSKIAGILSSLDAKIETNNKLNEKLEEMAQAIFKSWFVDFEPFKNKPFHETELGMIPEGWEVYMGSDLYKINIGKTPPRKESKWFSLNHNDIKWISISDLGKSGIFILDSSEKLTKEAINKHNIIVVPKNTILLSFKLTIGRVAICNSEMTTNEAIARFYLNDESDMEYLFMYLKNYNFDLLGSTSSIATAVNSKIIKKMPILKPSSEVINEFHCKINPLFEMIRTNIEENACLASLRDTLLPRLMSGEIKI